jgi:hypothetical protein
MIISLCCITVILGPCVILSSISSMCSLLYMTFAFLCLLSSIIIQCIRHICCPIPGFCILLSLCLLCMCLSCVIVSSASCLICISLPCIMLLMFSVSYLVCVSLPCPCICYIPLFCIIEMWIYSDYIWKEKGEEETLIEKLKKRMH